MSVIEDVCYVHGHRISSLRASDVVDPQSKAAIQRFEIRCTQCGKDLDSIETHKRAGKSRTKKPKGQVTNEHNHSSAAGSSEAGSQDPIGSTVRSA